MFPHNAAFPADLAAHTPRLTRSSLRPAGDYDERFASYPAPTPAQVLDANISLVAKARALGGVRRRASVGYFDGIASRDIALQAVAGVA